jgi:hypothetical protein
MKLNAGARGTALLGDLIAAVFDEAERLSSDPKEVSRLASKTVRYLLRASRGGPPPDRGEPDRARRP